LIFQENGFGLEHLLHRGRALAAFNQILGHRVQNLKSEGESSTSAHGQTNIQSDVQTLLSPLEQSEETLLSCVSFFFFFCLYRFYDYEHETRVIIKTNQCINCNAKKIGAFSLDKNLRADDKFHNWQ